MSDELVYKEEGFQIIGACMEVHNEKGAGFLESVYQECLAIEFDLRKVPFAEQLPLPIDYKGVPLKSKYVPDFICYDKIVVEIKATGRLTDPHRAQLLNYLRATNMKLGILVNFSSYPKLEYQRIVQTPKDSRH